MCKCVGTFEPSFPLADRFQSSPPPHSSVLFVSWKCDFREAWLPLPQLPLSHPPSHSTGISSLPPRPRAAYTVDLLHCSTLALAWGDITIVMPHSTPGANECHKRNPPVWHLSQTLPLSLFPGAAHTPLILLLALSHLLSVFVLFFSRTHPLLPFLHTVWFEVCVRLAGFTLLN